MGGRHKHWTEAHRPRSKRVVMYAILQDASRNWTVAAEPRHGGMASAPPLRLSGGQVPAASALVDGSLMSAAWHYSRSLAGRYGTAADTRWPSTCNDPRGRVPDLTTLQAGRRPEAWKHKAVFPLFPRPLLCLLGR
jgi:hypothetical protein